MKLNLLYVPIFLLALAAVPLLGGTALAAPSASDVPVQAINFAFDPKVVTIAAGDTVVWTNTDKIAHTVTASDGSWDSGRLEAGQSFSRKFDSPGTIAYYCKPHGKPDGTGMAGTVIVQAAATGGAAAPAQPQAPARQPAATQQPTAGQQAPSQQAGAQGPSPSVQVSSQRLQGDTVTVAQVVAAQEGWMVIHTNTADNKPGPVIGESPVKVGENANVRVNLSPAPKAGDKLWAMLHIDAGQKGVYEFPGADVPVQKDGMIVMEQFSLQSSASPATLPSAGSSDDSSSLWLLAAAAGVALLAGGLLIRTAGRFGR